MTARQQIDAYIAAQPDARRADMEALHRVILARMPKCRLWFVDGTDAKGKVVSNPSIGYGLRTIRYSDGRTRDFYQVGLSANTTGLSVYILGIEDKQYLARTYGKALGKAKVTGYCIKFRRLEEIDTDVLVAAIGDGVEQSRL